MKPSSIKDPNNKDFSELLNGAGWVYIMKISGSRAEALAGKENLLEANRDDLFLVSDAENSGMLAIIEGRDEAFVAAIQKDLSPHSVH